MHKYSVAAPWEMNRSPEPMTFLWRLDTLALAYVKQFRIRVRCHPLLFCCYGFSIVRASYYIFYIVHPPSIFYTGRYTNMVDWLIDWS